MEIDSLPVVACVAQSRADELVSALARDGYQVYEIPTAVDNDDAFLGEAQNVLPLPGDGVVSNWDGFADRLWQGLAGVDADRFAIVWRDAHETAARGLGTLLMASRVIGDVARQVATTEHGFPREAVLRLLLLGDGPSFR